MIRNFKTFIFFLLVIFTLSSCNSLQKGDYAVEPTNGMSITPTHEVVSSPIPTFTVIPDTPEPFIQNLFDPIRCTEDYCIFNAPALLVSPIPVSKNQIADVTYRYGTTQMGQREKHLGMDISNPSGTPVLAAADGTVAVAGNDNEVRYHPYENFYGNLVIVKHELPGLEQSMYTLYAHLSEVSVQKGQTVKAGEQVGLVGATGAAIGSHLHFEVRLGSMDFNSTSNPELWLLPIVNGNEIQTGILAVTVNNANNIPIESLMIIARTVGADPEKSRSANYGESYASGIPSTEPWNEIAVFGSIAPGEYEIIFEKFGKFYRTTVEVEPGRLTLATIDM